MTITLYHNLTTAYGALDIAGLSIAGLSAPLGVGVMGIGLYEWAKNICKQFIEKPKSEPPIVWSSPREKNEL